MNEQLNDPQPGEERLSPELAQKLIDMIETVEKEESEQVRQEPNNDE